MCGIIALASLDGKPVDMESVRSMTDSLRHRGPDGQGVVALGGSNGRGAAPVALGHTRLAILDLGERAGQPMHRDGYYITYNGEVYNYVELRRELELSGYSFSTTGDTEVLLNAYRHWGESCLEHLNGIFAFVVYDPRDSSLFAARDRLGVKPLYYVARNGLLGIASEIRALRVAFGDFNLNESLVHDFLVAGRLEHTDQTFFSGIAHLPAGCQLKLRNGEFTVKRYWEPCASRERWMTSFEDNVEEFGCLFRDAIRLQMRADVPVACCLSGGLDSTSVAAVASTIPGEPMSMFTARYDHSQMDEWRYAQTLHAQRPVVPVAVFARPKDFWMALDEVLHAQEEPFGGPGVFAQWRLMKEIKSRDIKVVLDGQGGDELLCGYAKYYYFRLAELLRAGRYVSAAGSALSIVGSGGSHLFNFSGARRYLPGGSWLSHRQGQLLQDAFVQRQLNREMPRPQGNVVDQQLLDITTYGLPTLLRYEDKNSMTHSVESRVPFLDHRLVEFALSVPVEHKLKGAKSKMLLRESLRGTLPEKVRRRRSKLGFGGHWHLWVQDLHPDLAEWLTQPRLQIDQFVKRDAASQLLRDRDPDIFRLLILDRWLQREFPEGTC